MAYYESVFIARQDLTAQQVEGIATTMTEILGQNGGKVTKTEQWGLRTLAYRINKNRKGHYVLFNIEAPAAAVQEMERNMRLSEDILRYLTTKVEALDPNPSAILRREERDDREGGFGGDRGGREGGFRGGDRPRRDGSGRPPRHGAESSTSAEG